LCATYPDAIHPQLLATEDITAEEAAVARSNALAALLDHEGVMADIRGITLSNNVAMRLQVRDVERSLSASRPADALAPESVRQQLADLEARGALPLDAFRQAAETTERLQRHARETLNEQAPNLSRLTQLLALLPGAIRTTTPEILPQPVVEQPESTAIVHTEQISSEQIALQVHIAEEISPMSGAEPRQIRDRNDALERLRVIRRWFEHSEPSSPTIPLLRQAERLVGKLFSEGINENPVDLLEKW
ncbi:ImpA family type VI secretion system protein, partial [Escherichia coli]|uniref:type VI secretion system protein TssA n=1 Tax=Escherichia coli TaxID=562 RepID=UPI003CE8009B